MPLLPAELRSIQSRADQVQFAREILRAESQAILGLTDRLGDPFCDAVDLVHSCQGHVVVSGIGKAGLIGQKLTATLASTGTRSHFLHPAEALHGDLGRLHPDDLLLILSFSGATGEIVRLLPCLRDLGSTIIAVTGQPESPLAQAAQVVLDLGPLREACPLGLAPTTSTTAMLALGDALALVVSRLRQFGPSDFARFHPGGSLGRRLAKVEDLMRPRGDCRVASQDHSVRQVFVQLSRPGRRTGAIMLVDLEDRLTGLFTDSDLARLLERNRDADFDQPIAQVMTRAPRAVPLGTSLDDAIHLLAGRKLSELPVVDAEGRPCGILDITDVVAFLPRESTEESAASPPPPPPPPPSTTIATPVRSPISRAPSPSRAPAPDSPATLPFAPVSSSTRRPRP